MKDTIKMVAIPEEIYAKIEEKLKDSGESSVEKYVLKTLKENLGMADALSDEDEEKVKERLKALGYMD